MILSPAQLRSRAWALLGSLLAAAPDAALLETLRGIDAGEADDEVGGAWAALAAAARRAETASIDDEYHDLFIGLGRGELMPYASWYRTGFLHEKPLADLRSDLLCLGIERDDGVREPEDHAAALCQAMSLLCDEMSNADQAAQRQFFARHLAPWVRRFFADLAAARSAGFYRAVGRLGGALSDLECRYLDLDESAGYPAVRQEERHAGV
jgi:TorA maturation chaperone TorD